MIYVPDLQNYKCFIVQSEGVIRAYEEIPQINKTINYRDYYINSNYIYKDGYQSFSSYSTFPICLERSNLSTDVMYRNDYDQILIIFLVMFIFIVYIPMKLFFKFFRRFNL